MRRHGITISAFRNKCSSPPSDRSAEKGRSSGKKEARKVIRAKRDVADRAHVLGGSSVGAALGYGQYKTPYETALEYLGRSEKITDPETLERFEHGHIMEEAISKMVERRYGVTLRKTPYAYVSSRNPRLICHPDRLQVEMGERGERVAWEMKSVSSSQARKWGEEGTDEVPLDYLIQGMSYIECDVADTVKFARFTDNRLFVYELKGTPLVRDFINDIMDKAVLWMDKVDSGWLPEALSYDEAKRKYPTVGEDEREATDEELTASIRLDEIASQKKTLSAEEDKIKCSLVEAMGRGGIRRLLDRDGKTLRTYIKSSRKILDSARLRNEKPDIFEEYSKESSSTQLR